MMRRWRERGGVMITTAVAFLALLLFAGLALDFGRAHLLRAQLQTAVDASALAGALQVVPMVAIERDRYRLVEESCTDPVTGLPYNCSHWEKASPAKAEGTERYIKRERGWERETAAQCGHPFRCNDYRVVRDWLVLPVSTEPTAREAFGKNESWPANGSLGATLESVAVGINQSKAEVTTTATIRIPTSFLRLIGIKELRFTRKGSAIPVRR
jgi:hypothetical protein